jgi:hypothetical protein
MKLIKNLVTVNLSEGDDLDALPPDIINEIKKNIREGSKDLTQQWPNALSLVHKAYEVAVVERPDPSLKQAWKQYETMITYAVQQLAKDRGISGDWRMTCSTITEAALTPKPKLYRVTYSDPRISHGYTVTSNNIDEIINHLTHEISYDAHVSKNSSETAAEIAFSKWGIKKGVLITIRKVT